VGTKPRPALRRVVSDAGKIVSDAGKIVSDAGEHAPVSIVLAGLLVLTVGTGATALTASAFTGHPSPRPVTRHVVTVPTPTPSATSSARPSISSVASAPTTHAAPVPAVTPTAVPRPKHLVESTLLVSGRQSLTHHQIHQLASLDHVKQVERVSTGTARIDRHRGFVLGVDPASFRPWTPKLTAKSNPLWASIARGELAASFDMGKGAKLPLGKDVSVTSRDTQSLRIGAFASVGMSGVDAVVTQTQAHRIGLVHNSGMVLSAPKADPLVLRKAALAIVGHHARAELLREVVVTRDAGEYLTRTQISTFLKAAASRVGLPYVWGAVGPKSFDCSGLVQWSFAKAGIRMPRVSQQQWLTGPHIAYKDARPGDLLFWHYDPTDPANIDHVAIYAGNGMMLVAPHTGTDVGLNPVPLSHLAGVVRVDPALASQIS
jgi:hypothetical protein